MLRQVRQRVLRVHVCVLRHVLRVLHHARDLLRHALRVHMLSVLCVHMLSVLHVLHSIMRVGLRYASACATCAACEA
jgi:hypothetical protein